MVIDFSNWKFWREVCKLEIQKQELEAALAAERERESANTNDPGQDLTSKPGTRAWTVLD